MESQVAAAQPVQRQGLFDRVADFMSYAIGTPLAFLAALSVIVVWAVLGPFASFSTTWQLVINTGTTIVTFLMVFLLGNASNRITASQEKMLQGILHGGAGAGGRVRPPAPAPSRQESGALESGLS